MLGIYLDLSTAHITKQDSILLTRPAYETNVVAYNYDEGFFVPISSTSEDNPVDEFSSQFKAIYQYCRDNNINMLRLDADADQSAQFPTFDW